MSVDIGGADLYPSDCCTIKSRQEFMSDRRERTLDPTGAFDSPYESNLPPDINTQDYGVGNYFLETAIISRNIEPEPNQFDYTRKRTGIYFLNNCGDVLFKPAYWRINK